MSDSEHYREAYRDELEDARECPLHPGCLMYPDRGIPCTACEDGEPVAGLGRASAEARFLDDMPSDGVDEERP